MDVSPENLIYLWQKLIWPLCRLLIFISVGLIAANVIESLNWTRRVAAVARPLVKLGHFSERVGAAFSIAIISGVAANTMLAEAYDQKQLSKKELILANLFNSLPTYFLHLPTMIVITLPLIKGAAFIYIGITFTAAMLRTFAIVVASRFILPKPEETVEIAPAQQKKQGWKDIALKTWRRFKRRIKKIIVFTVPIYIIIFIMNRLHFFTLLESSMAAHLDFHSLAVTTVNGYYRPAVRRRAYRRAGGRRCAPAGQHPLLPGNRHCPFSRQHPLFTPACRQTPIPLLRRHFQAAPRSYPHNSEPGIQDFQSYDCCHSLSLL